MEARCDKCQARYKVDDARIGPQGLTMRCGKCQNTFKVMKPAAEAAPEPPAPPPPVPKAPPKAAPKEGATMMFAAPKLDLPKPGAPPARSPTPPAGAAKPAPAAAKPAAPASKPPATAAPAEEGAGRTMMFQTGNLKAPPPAKPAPA